MKLKQIPKYTSIALMKQLALGRDVLAPIIRVVIVNTVVTPLTVKNKHEQHGWHGGDKTAVTMTV